jgi:hypothetical protein
MVAYFREGKKNMTMHGTNKKKTHLSWRQFLKLNNPFSTYRMDFPEAEDPKVQKRLLLFLKFIQVSQLVTIPIAIISLVKILPSIGFIPQVNAVDDGELIFWLYLACLIYFALGFKWATIYKWINKYTNSINRYNDPFMAAYTGYLGRITWFWAIVPIGFLLGITVANWWVTTPTFIISGVALILTFPTDKNWANWINGLMGKKEKI